MHLWPSVRIRDSFKISYLKKLEWNLSRMNSEKKQQSQSNDQQQTLLVDDNNQRNDISETPSAKKSHFGSGFVAVCGEILMVLSCCYCCFCCGGTFDFFLLKLKIFMSWLSICVKFKVWRHGFGLKVTLFCWVILFCVVFVSSLQACWFGDSKFTHLLQNSHEMNWELDGVGALHILLIPASARV